MKRLRVHAAAPVPLRVVTPLGNGTRGADGLVPCLECGHCCTYVAVGINAPRTPRYATDVLWYLYHERVSVHRDVDGEWSVVFETRCRNLGDDLLCRVYPERPHICRAFDNTGCEVNAPDNRDQVFTAPAEFLDYLKGWRPKVYAQIERRYVPSRPAPAAPAPAAMPATRVRQARRTTAARRRGRG